MSKQISGIKKPLIVSSLAVLGLVLAPLAVEQATGAHVSIIGTAQAAGGPSGSGSGAMGGQGAAGTGGHSGTDAVLSGEDEEGDGGKGSMQQGGGSDHEHGGYDSNKQQGGGSGGPGEDSDAKGPRYGGGGTGDDASHGGKPIWAQEGIPEVELGRLSVARSPSHVLQKALDEALANFTTSMVTLYDMTAEDAANLLKTQYDTTVRIDSPLENLALYQELLTDGSTQLPGVTPASRNDLAAILLGSASDKTLAVTEDTVKAVSIILGVQDNLTASDITEIATKAEDVRAAISEGHGE